MWKKKLPKKGCIMKVGASKFFLLILVGIARAMNNSIGWRLKRLLSRYYKDDFNLSAFAILVYKNDGRVFFPIPVVNPRNAESKVFEKELENMLYYGWMPPKVHTDIGNDEIAQDIVEFVKIHLAFTRDYRMVCKQNGRDAKDSVIKQCQNRL